MESFSDEMSTPDFVDRVDLKLIKIDDKFYRQLWCHAMGLWHASEYIEKGCYSIESIARLMIKDFGDVIRPQIVPCYEESREWYKYHGQKDVIARMDPPEFVDAFDADTFDKPAVDEECFYAPMDPGFLTIAMHPGVLNKYDILENIVLIGMMSEQEEREDEISVEEALRRREDLSGQELMNWAGREESCWRDPAWAHVWKAYNLNPEEATSPDGEQIPLFPIEVVFADNGNRLSKSEAKARMIEMMENSYFERFWEPTPEWDHAGPE